MTAEPLSGPELEALAGSRLDELTELAWRAGASILEIEAAKSRPRLKADHSPVCKADLKAEAVIIEGLLRLFPDLPVVSEEAVAANSGIELTGSFALVDALDGTREYLGGRGEFTVNIAIIVGGTPVIGLIAAPALATIWRGVVGRGAERLRLPAGTAPRAGGRFEPIRCRPRPRDGLAIAISRSHFEASTASLIAGLKVASQLACGSSLKFCRLAEGSADLYPRLAPIHEWDIAAGQAVLTAAGGLMVSPDGGPIAYGSAANGFCVPGFLAFGDPSLAPQVTSLAHKACHG